MERPWLPEREVDAELAERLITRQFPELAPRSGESIQLAPHPPGWDNTTFVVKGPRGRRNVFRFPRRAVAVPLLENETAVLARLAQSNLGLSVPVPKFAGVRSDEFPWPFTGYPELAGETADRANLSDAQRSACARPLAQFLRVLHSLEPGSIGAGPDSFARLDVAKRRADIEQRLDHLERRQLGGDLRPLRAFHRHVTIAADSEPLVVCHGDLYARHLIVNRQRKLTGVIDWGDVHTGPGAIDVAVAFTFLPKSDRPAFFDEYGALNPATRDIALYRAVLSAITIAVFGDDADDATLLREGLRAIDNVRSAL